MGFSLCIAESNEWTADITGAQVLLANVDFLLHMEYIIATVLNTAGRSANPLCAFLPICYHFVYPTSLFYEIFSIHIQMRSDIGHS